MLKIVDIFECDLRGIKPERKARFLKDSAVYSTPGEHPVPQLIVTVAATHAGLMTRNKSFYRPDAMRSHLESFLKPFAKPVQVHHSDHVDPVGRVRGARYVDISNRYMDPMRNFRNAFKGQTFLDAKASNEKAFDQVKWVLQNLQGMKDYQGLGYGELDLHISDAKTAEKILDERYMTVSVGFSTTEAYCSECKQDWAGSDGPCEHKPGEMYDGCPMVLIPSNMLYEEVSWVNNPADQFAQVLNVMKTGTPTAETVSAEPLQNHDLAIAAILTGVTGEGIYRLDSYRDVDEARAQEILNVAKKIDSKEDEKPQTVELIEFDGSQYPKAATELLATDAKRENWITDAASAGEVPEHKHRVVIDPATGNGYCDYVAGHSHDIVNREVADAKVTRWDEKTGKSVDMGSHGHKLAAKVDKLTDAKKEADDVELCDTCKSKKDDTELCDACKKKMKNAKDAEMCPDCGKPVHKGACTDDEVQAEEVKDEVIEETTTDDSITDETIKSEDFYEKYFVPILTELEAGDATLSAEARKGLKASTFCGPGRSFPVPDCAHVTAARRLIGRFKGNKAGILACVNRKAKSLGCDKSKDAFEPLDVILVNPQTEAEVKEFTVRVSDVDDFQVAIHTLDAATFEANKDRLYEIGKLLDMTKEQVDAFTKAEPTTVPLEKAIATVEGTGTIEITDQFVSNLITTINQLPEDARAILVETMKNEFIKAGFLPDYDDEYNELVDEIAELKAKIARMRAANRDLYAGQQSLLAETIVQLKASLLKQGDEGMDEAARSNKVAELKLRSVDSLKDSLNDLTSEIAGAKAEPELDAVAGQPGSLSIKEPVKETGKESSSTSKKFDVSALGGIDEHSYQLARTLTDAFEGIKKTPSKS